MPIATRGKLHRRGTPFAAISASEDNPPEAPTAGRNPGIQFGVPRQIIVSGRKMSWRMLCITG
ncbi:protein of unknown function (plasmid) [Caballeronia sp. S22]